MNPAALFRNSANLRMKMELESVAALNLFQDNQRETKYTSARDTYAVDRTRKADDLNQRYRGVAIFRLKSWSRQPASLGISIALPSRMFSVNAQPPLLLEPIRHD